MSLLSWNKQYFETVYKIPKRQREQAPIIVSPSLFAIHLQSGYRFFQMGE